MSYQTDSPSPNWSTFNFTTPTVDKSGQIIRETTYQVNYYEEMLDNSISLHMISIPAGKFMMGTKKAEIEIMAKKFNAGLFTSEDPEHQVSLEPFLMSKYPITQVQWSIVAGWEKVKIDLPENPAKFVGMLKPVERVSWEEAQEFCQRLSAKTQKHYHLPSEAQWEYACRAGTQTPFSFGETLTVQLANYQNSSIYSLEEKNIYSQEEVRGKTTEVGIFPPNAFGLCDMHGQVVEWCEDDWHPNYENAPIDGTAWVDKDNYQAKKVIRGGAWYFAPWSCRSATRSYNAYDYIFGFRVVLSY